jgi:hypothetical protein
MKHLIPLSPSSLILHDLAREELATKHLKQCLATEQNSLQHPLKFSIGEMRRELEYNPNKAVTGLKLAHLPKITRAGFISNLSSP